MKIENFATCCLGFVVLAFGCKGGGSVSQTNAEDEIGPQTSERHSLEENSSSMEMWLSVVNLKTLEKSVGEIDRKFQDEVRGIIKEYQGNNHSVGGMSLSSQVVYRIDFSIRDKGFVESFYLLDDGDFGLFKNADSRRRLRDTLIENFEDRPPDSQTELWRFVELLKRR